MNEALLLGLGLGGLLWLMWWRSGGRLTPWREALAFVGVALALWLVLRVSGVFDPSTSVFVGFVAAAIVLAVWRRAHRPI